jgi:hypothetical protein
LFIRADRRIEAGGFEEPLILRVQGLRARVDRDRPDPDRRKVVGVRASGTQRGTEGACGRDGGERAAARWVRLCGAAARVMVHRSSENPEPVR